MPLQDDTVKKEPRYRSHAAVQEACWGMQEQLNGTMVFSGSPFGPVVPARHTKVSPSRHAAADRGRLRSQAQFVGSCQPSPEQRETGQFHCAGMHGVTLASAAGTTPASV